MAANKKTFTITFDATAAPPALPAKVFGFRVALQKTNNWTLNLLAPLANKIKNVTRLQEMFDCVSVRVHLNNVNKIKFIQIPNWICNKNMGITSIDGYDQNEGTVIFKTSTDPSKIAGVNRWTGSAADRKLFVGCLTYPYSQGHLSHATGCEGRKLLKFLVDHFDYKTSKKHSDQRLADFAKNYPSADWNPVKKYTRRRLVELAYYSFIGFNMLLMCCLLVGISFAYHVGTHEVNHEPIRW